MPKIINSVENYCNYYINKKKCKETQHYKTFVLFI